MREQPSAAELLDAVAGFLRQQARPELAGQAAFHRRVALNVLDIVRREMTLGPAAEAREAERLAALLGRDGDAATLNRLLCEAIASGTIDPGEPALVLALWATCLDTLAIDQPGYATFQRALAAFGPTAADNPGDRSGDA